MKKNKIKSFFAIFVFYILFLMSNSYANQELILEDFSSESISKNFSEVHFGFGGNDFGGWFLRTAVDDVNVEIKWNGTQNIICRKQLNWYYYNWLRWERIFPIDQKSLELLREQNTNYNDMSIEWWFYTNCEWEPYSRYGQIKYTINGEVSYLIAWVQFDLSWNNYSNNLKPSFQNFQNNIPIWFVFDSNYGQVWFVWWKMDSQCYEYIEQSINDNKSINQIFTNNSWNIQIIWHDECVILNGNWNLWDWAWAWLETMLGIAIKWNISMSKSMDQSDRSSLKWNFNYSTLLQDTNLTIWSIVSRASNNWKNLCKSKPRSFANSWKSVTDDVICIEYANYDKNNAINIDLSNDNYNWKTFIIKNADVVFSNTMSSTKSIDLFLDWWNLVIKEWWNREIFSKEWYLTNIWNKVTEWVLLQWNFIINGLVLWADSSNVYGTFKNRLFIYGKLASLNTPTDPQPWRLTQISKIVWANAYSWHTSLMKVFVWRCNPMTWKWTDNIACGGTNETNLSPLTVIDKKRPSNLLKQ